jgi:hypothetical protein
VRGFSFSGECFAEMAQRGGGRGSLAKGGGKVSFLGAERVEDAQLPPPGPNGGGRRESF